MTLRVMLLDDNRDRRDLVRRALEQEGFVVAAELGTNEGLLESVARVEPDVVIIDLDSPDRDILESMSQLSRDNPHPVVVFAEKSDRDTIRKAVESGVSAYVVNGLSPERVCAVVNLAIARFDQYDSMRKALHDAQSSLQDRKVIDRAKGIIMGRGRYTEAEAYHSMRKLAMDQNKTIAEIARSVIATADLLE